MKKNLLMLLGVAVMFFACQNETVTEEQKEVQVTEESMEDEIIVPDGEEDATLEFNDESENLVSPSISLDLEMSSQSKSSGPKAIKECKVIDADLCNNPNQPKSNFWWPETETDYTSGFFGTTDDHKLKLTEYNDGSAHLTGTTNAIVGDCVVTIDVWFIGKSNWTEWQAAGNDWKDEGGCSGDVKENLNYYKIDDTRSTITSAGSDCLGQGVYGLTQRPEEKYGVQVGPGGAIWDSNVGAEGLGTWGWITDINTNERLWVMDFNFLLECADIEKCKDCKGDVNELTLEFDWCRSKRVKVYQKKGNSCRAVKIFDKVLAPHEQFTLNGVNNDGSFGRYIYIKIGHCYYTKINTNCWTKIGPGYEKGVFNVVSGTSTDGGELCDYVKPDNKCYRHWFCKYYSKCRYW
ncbi:hypothetical protein [Algibacter sp. 2305UL17-15]|uniref:hypothetical protein n=1 Tax=Algibacter sp. 2305UL17-15 TaxID=3231268 RepID=UPI003457D83B